VQLTLQPRILRYEIRVIDYGNGGVVGLIPPRATGSAVLSFIVDDAIVRLAQSLTKAANQFASDPRRVRDLIEEFGWGEYFHLDGSGGSRSRAAWAIFHDTHFPDKLARADLTKKDGVAIEFSEYVDGAAE
jgi:hypothetical protein